jgi:5'-nucleotidase
LLNLVNTDIVLLDLDNTITRFDKGMEDWLAREHPQIKIVPTSQRRTFWYQDDYPKELHPLLEAGYCSQGFFLGLQPIPGAIEAIHVMTQEEIEVIFCSSNVQSNPYCAGEKHTWIDRNIGPEYAERLILSTDKTLIYGKVLVDDNPELKGVLEVPSWQRVIFDQPYNQGIEGPRIKPDWSNWREAIYPLIGRSF